MYARNSNAITIGNKLRANLLKNEQLLPGDPSNCRFAISRLDNETLSTFLYNRYANCGVDTILCQSHAKSSRTKKATCTQKCTQTPPQAPQSRLAFPPVLFPKEQAERLRGQHRAFLGQAYARLDRGACSECSAIAQK